MKGWRVSPCAVLIVVLTAWYGLLLARLMGYVSWSWWLLLSPVWAPTTALLIYLAGMNLGTWGLWVVCWVRERPSRHREEQSRRAFLRMLESDFLKRNGLTRNRRKAVTTATGKESAP